MNNFLFGQFDLITLGWALVHFIWQGCLIALVLELVLHFVSPKSPSIRYVLCWSALAVMPMLLVGTFLVVQQHSLPAGVHPLGISVENSKLETTESGKTSFKLTWRQPSLSLSLRAQMNYYMPVISLIWLLGVLLLSSRKMGGFYILRRLRYRDVTEPGDLLLQLLQQACQKMGIKPDGILLMMSLQVQVPITMGWFKPIILFPASLVCGLSSTEMELLLAHELAHIYRGDYLFNLIQSAIEILFFFHPVTWWISNRIRQERELACDALVLQHFAAPLPYAKALLHLERLQVHQPLANAANGGSLLQRVQRVLGAPVPSDRDVARICGLFALTIIMPVMVTIGQTPDSQMSFPWHEGIKTTMFSIGEGPNSPPPAGNATNWFYVALPFNDLANPEKAKQWVPTQWHRNPLNGKPVSSCYKRWVEIKNKEGKSCYAQWTDVGPLQLDNGRYNPINWGQAAYVFGSAQPKAGPSGLPGAGLDVSPGVASFLNLSPNEKTSWRFVDEANVPPDFSAANQSFVGQMPIPTLDSQQIPSGITIGKRGFVLSPYAPDKPMVDVRGFVAGDKVRCPYTNKIFIAPSDTTKSSQINQAATSADISLGQSEISISQVRESPVDLENGNPVSHLSVDLVLRKNSNFDQKKLRCFVVFYHIRPDGSYSMDLSQKPGEFDNDILFRNRKTETFELLHTGTNDYGYVMGIYYDGLLQDARSEPTTLLKEKPLRQTLVHDQ